MGAMRTTFVTATLLLVPALRAQPIIAQTSGLASPDAVIDFGANLFPNFTPVSTEFPGVTVTHARYFTTGTVNNLVGGFLTNDPIGLPNTLTIVFDTPITDLSFVYHQISTAQPSAFRAVLSGFVVDSFTNLSDQFQPNNYFGFTNTLFDELQIDFVADFNVDTLAFNLPPCGALASTGISSSCPASANGPVLSFAGLPTRGGTFDVQGGPLTGAVCALLLGVEIPPIPLSAIGSAEPGSAFCLTQIASFPCAPTPMASVPLAVPIDAMCGLTLDVQWIDYLGTGLDFATSAVGKFTVGS